jgi:hypothetical protein
LRILSRPSLTGFASLVIGDKAPGCAGAVTVAPALAVESFLQTRTKLTAALIIRIDRHQDCLLLRQVHGNIMYPGNKSPGNRQTDHEQYQPGERGT